MPGFCNDTIPQGWPQPLSTEGEHKRYDYIRASGDYFQFRDINVHMPIEIRVL
jgi:hypothetical protein